MFRRLGSLMPRPSTAFAYECLGASRGRGAVALTGAAGATPSAALCDMVAGLFSQVPVAFGLPPASVGHPQCQARGGARCVFELAWAERSRLPWRRRQERAKEAQVALRGLAQRVDDLAASAADLASTDDLPTVLHRAVGRGGNAVGAERYALAVRPAERREPVVSAENVDDATLAALVGALDAPGGPAVLGGLAAEVASARHRYGWFVAWPLAGVGFEAQEARVLAAYARHAAAALDEVARRLSDAVRPGDTVCRLGGDGYEALLAAADAATYRARARSRTDEAEIRRLPRRAV